MNRYLYAALAVAFVIVSGRLLMQYTTASAPMADAFWATVEPISFEEARAERTALLDIAYAPPDDPETYYTQVLARTDILELRIERTMRDRWRVTENWAGLNTIGGSTMNVRNIAQEAYGKKFGREHMADVGAGFRKTYRRPTPEMPDAGPYLVRWYLICMMLSAFFFVLRVHDKGLTLWVELLQPQQFLLALFAWPVFMWKYPMHTPANQMRWALRYATLVLGTMLSGGAGVAKAADSKDGSKRDRKGKHSLQVDLRAADTIGGPPAPEAFGRATLTHSSGVFLESVNVVKPGFRLTSDTLGLPLIKGGLGVINGVAGVVATNTGSRSYQASFQVFGGTKHFGIAFPVLGVERQWRPTWTTTFATTGQVFAKPTPRLRVGVEGSVRKTPGARPSWYLGGLVGWSFGKGKPAVEGFILHNSAGVERARVRMTHAFAF